MYGGWKDLNNTSPKQHKKTVKRKNNKLNKPLLVIYGILSTIALTAIIVISCVLFHSISVINGDLIVNLDEYKENQNQTSFIYAYDKDGNQICKVWNINHGSITEVKDAIEEYIRRWGFAKR